MELDVRNPVKQPGGVMAAVTYVCSIDHVAASLGEDPELLKAIVSVQIGEEDYITALTGDGIEELQDMLANARVSIKEWHSFLDNFVAEPDIIARVKNQPMR